MRKSRRVDPDISALKACAKALRKSSSTRMLKANLEFLWWHFVDNPNYKHPTAQEK